MLNKSVLSILRKLMPASVAQDIVGVQPMNTHTMHGIFTMKDGKVAFKHFTLATNQNECVLYDTPERTHYAVDVRLPMTEWLENQPKHMWKYADETDDCHLACTRYIVCEELLTWMTLKWG
jgi:hypothetical protein